ncbi:MAG: hypothetical protein U0176_22770 [Bacteroidia bacterium]
MEVQETKAQEHSMIAEPVNGLRTLLQIQIEGDPQQVLLPESEWGMAFRVRRKAIRGMLRVFWWSAFNVIALVIAGESTGFGHGWRADFGLDDVVVLSFMFFYLTCGVTAIAGAFANSRSFVYKSWEAAGFAFANVIFYFGLLIGFLLWLK